MTTAEQTLPKINARHVSYAEIVESLRPAAVETAANGNGSMEVLPEIARSGGAYASATKSRVLVKDARNRMAVIGSPGGSPGDPHLHADFNEWWIVFGGEMRYTIGEYEPFLAHYGDIVVAPCGYRHDPRAWKGDMCMRMVIGMDGSNHDLKGLPHARSIPLDDRWEPPNRIFTPLEYMKRRHGTAESWSETVILDQRNRVVMHHAVPGDAVSHVSGDAEAWWVVLEGAATIGIGSEPEFAAESGAVVYAADGEPRRLSASGDVPTICVEVVAP